MKTLQILLVMLFCTTPLYADQAHLLTEVEQIQEKIWYQQRDITAHKTSLAEYQKQLKLLAAKIEKGQSEFSERLTGMAQVTLDQQDKAQQVENSLQELSEALSILSGKIELQNRAMQEQEQKLASVEASIPGLREELAAIKSGSELALAKTNSRINALSQDTNVRVEQIILWGGAAALLLAIVLTISLAFRKNHAKSVATRQKRPPRHEM